MTSDVQFKTTVPAIFVGFQGRRRMPNPRYALLDIDHVKTRSAAEKYIGNAVCMEWINKEGCPVKNRGVIRHIHGNKGIVRAIFERNLSPAAIGKNLCVKLYKEDDMVFQ